MSKEKIDNINNHIMNITNLWNEKNDNDNQQSFYENPTITK
jgi:hypothetical protein